MTIRVLIASWISAVFLLSFMATAYAQTSYYKLDRRKSAVGVSFEQEQHDDLFKNIWGDLDFTVRTFRTSFDYGYKSDTKISLIPGLGFTQVELADVPPAPSFELRIMNIGPFGSTELDYYIVGNFGVVYRQLHISQSVLHLVEMNLKGGIGFAHTMHLNNDVVLRPFFGGYYTNIWTNISTTSRIFADRTSGIFTGEAGVEIELTPTINLTPTWIFSFENSDTYFKIGLNFH